MTKDSDLIKWRTYNLDKKMKNDMCASLGITKDQFSLYGIDEIENLIEKRNDKRIVLGNGLFDKIARNIFCNLGWHIEYKLLFNYLNIAKYKCIYCGKKCALERHHNIVGFDGEW